MVEIRAGVQAAITSGGPTQAFGTSLSPAMGATPKLGTFEMSGATALATPLAPARWGLGGTDGTLQRAMAILADSGVAAGVTDAAYRLDTGSVIQRTITTGNPVDAVASHVSFAAGQETLTWSDFPLTAGLVKYELIGGADFFCSMSEATSGAVQDVSKITVSGLPFAPNFVRVFAVDSAAWSANFSSNPRRTSIGYAVKTKTGGIEQVCLSDIQSNNTTACRTILRDDRVAQRLTATAETCALELTAWTADGLEMTLRDASVALTVVMQICRFDRSDLRAFIPSGIVTSTTGNKTLSSLGLHPKCYWMLATDLSSKNTGSSGADASMWSHGIATGLEEVAIAFQSEDGAATSDSRSAVDLGIAYVVDAAGTLSWSANHVSFSDDQLVFNVDDASAADRVFAVVIVGAEHTEPGWLPATRRFRRQLARM